MQKLEGDEGHAGLFANLMDGDSVAVMNLRRRRGPREETAPSPSRLSNTSAHHLEGDLPFASHVNREEDAGAVGGLKEIERVGGIVFRRGRSLLYSSGSARHGREVPALIDRWKR